MRAIAWDLPAPRPSVCPTPPELAARRDAIAAAPAAARTPGVEVTRSEYGGVSCVVCTPARAPHLPRTPRPRHTIVHFHGGGYRLGSPEQSTPFATRLAAATGSRVVAVRYRLAPEHPFPAALLDATAAYGAVLDDAPDGVIAAGESAGGGLAAALTLACVAAGVAVPRALLLLSPWLDLTVSAGTYAANAATDQLFSAASAAEAAAMYLQGHDPRDPLASPGFGDVAAFPPTAVFAATGEVLLDDALTLVHRLAVAGVEVRAVLRPGVAHAWPAIFPDEPAGVHALAEIAELVGLVGLG